MTELAVLAADPGSALSAAADPGQFVVLACQRAKEWLAQAVEQGEIDQIVEVKSQAEAIRVYTMQKQLGKDAELAAAEIVRRAERGIGLAIRRGQETGEIRKQGYYSPPRKPYQARRGGRLVTIRASNEAGVRETNSRSPRAFFSSGDDGNLTYAVTDGVSDEQFESAIDQAKSEQNLSRKNVVRKVRAEVGPLTPSARRAAITDLASSGYPSRQIAEMVGISEERVRYIAREHQIDIPADRIFSGTRRTDSNRIVREATHALEGLAMGVQLVDVAELDTGELRHWATSLTDSMRVLNRFTKQIKEMTQ